MKEITVVTNPKAAGCWNLKNTYPPEGPGSGCLPEIHIISSSHSTTYLKRPLERVARKSGSLNLVKG